MSFEVKQKRNNFAIRPQNDLRVLRILLKHTRYIGLTPISLKTNEAKSIFAKCLVLVLVLCHIIYECSVYRLQIEYDLKQFNGRDDLFASLKTVWLMSNSLFIIVAVVKPNFFEIMNWKRFYAKLDELEIIMKKLGFQMTQNFFLLCSENFAYIILSLVWHVLHFNYLRRVGHGHKIHSYLGWTISHFYMTYAINLFNLVVKIIEKRYAYLNHILRLNSTSRNQVISNMETVLRVYKKLYLLLKNFNLILGLQIFLCILNTFTITVLNLRYYIINTNTIGLSLRHPLISMVLMYFTTLFIAIMACESVERNARNIIKTCYDIHETVEDGPLKERLITLVKYLNQWRPAFSAVGFFYVNQKTLPALLWAIIQYLVVIIQFSMATSETPTPTLQNRFGLY